MMIPKILALNALHRHPITPRIGQMSRVAVVALLALVAIAAPRSADLVLIKIDRLQPVAISPDAVRDVFPLHELQSGWIAEASEDAVARLRASGVSLRVLAPAPAGKRYFLAVSLPNRDLRGSLASLGTVTIIEDRVALVAAKETADLGAGVPADISFIPLDESARITMAFDVAGKDHARPRAASAAVSPDPRIASIANAVSKERLAARIRDLVAFRTRYASTSNCEAAGTSISDYFRSLGLATESDYFTSGSPPYSTSNIIATLPGRTAPEQVVIVGAHYDSAGRRGEALAPGADDNASGTAAVMEAARVLSSTAFDFTVKFIAFGAEESGLVGSRHYAQEARQRGEQIVGVINLDMIGYVDRAPEDVDVQVNADSDWLGALFVSAATTYAALPSVKQVNASTSRSDNLSFWNQGYPALLAIDDIPVTNPYYHTATDEFETLNMDFATAVSRAAVATVADLAQPASSPAMPTGLALTVHKGLSLFSTATTLYLTWNAVGGAAGYHVYKTAYSHANYQRLTTTPVKTTSYVERLVSGPGRNGPTAAYLVVTAVDAQGRESNRSVEVKVSLAGN